MPAVLDTPSRPSARPETFAPSVSRSRFPSRFPSRHAWLVCSATLLLLVIAVRWFVSQHPFPGDAWAAQLGASHKAWLVYKITRGYQQVGRPLVAIGEVLVMLLWLWRTSGQRAMQGLVIVLMASATCGLIKTICGPTPLWLSLHHVGSNFPSGVVTFVTATGGYLALIAWRDGRRILPAVLLAVIIGAGPSRVLGGQHVLSDVLCGYLVGTAWLIVAYRYALAPQRRGREEPAWNVASFEAPA